MTWEIRDYINLGSIITPRIWHGDVPGIGDYADLGSLSIPVSLDIPGTPWEIRDFVDLGSLTHISQPGNPRKLGTPRTWALTIPVGLGILGTPWEIRDPVDLGSLTHISQPGNPGDVPGN